MTVDDVRILFLFKTAPTRNMKPSKGLLELFRNECDKKCQKYAFFAHQIPFVAIHRLKYDNCMKECVETSISQEKKSIKTIIEQNKKKL